MVLNEVKSYEITCEPCGRANEKELGDIISRKIKDPRIGFVTVTDVQVVVIYKLLKYIFLF